MTASKTRTTAPAAPEPQNPADLLAAALAAMAAAEPQRAGRVTSQTQRETLAQELTERDRAALTRMGWDGRLSSPKPAAPKPTAQRRPGPAVKVSTFAELSPERQRSTQFWAGLCSTLSRSNGRVWLPEIAAAAAALQVPITSPAQLAARLSVLTGCTVARPSTDAGWLICELPGEMPGAQLWAQLWVQTVASFKA
jgi:hypothetical protein